MNSSTVTKRELHNPFSSLKYRNFRYYWIGMCVSLIGTWMQNIAQPWLAYTLTKSPFLLSLIGTLQYTPVLIFSLFAGTFIDKLPKKKILICTQTASLFITMILAILVWSGEIRYWHILILSTALGIVNTFDMPARHTFVIELVGKEDLMNAIALNSMAFNVARVIGPAVAGIIMGYIGITSCFFINSISFAAVLISLFFIKTTPLIRTSKENSRIMQEVKEGLKYIYHNKILFYTILVMAIVGTFAPNFNVLVPVFAKDILKQNEANFGILMSFMGVGSFFGAMCIATLSRSAPKKFILHIIPFIVGALLIITGYTSIFLMTGIFLAITGFFFISFTSYANSTLQLNSSNEYRGRVMSIYTLVMAGSTPFGNLYAGVFADRFNARIGFAACGAIIILLMLPLSIHRKRFAKSREE